MLEDVTVPKVMLETLVSDTEAGYATLVDLLSSARYFIHILSQNKLVFL